MKDLVIVVASSNGGKIIEICKLLESFPVKLKTYKDFHTIPIIKEDGFSFEENAYKKAVGVANFFGLPALGDDSGLIIPALNGAPGIYSSRYGGPNVNNNDQCNMILDELKITLNRKAYFECVLSLVVPGGESLTYKGRSYGRITNKLIGTSGFGYDPIFFHDVYNRTFAQLSVEDKNKISHRGIALSNLKLEFRKVIKWLDFYMIY